MKNNFFYDDFELTLKALSTQVQAYHEYESNRSPGIENFLLRHLAEKMEQVREDLMVLAIGTSLNYQKVTMLYWAAWWKDLQKHQLATDGHAFFEGPLNRNKVTGLSLKQDGGAVLWIYVATGRSLVEEGLLTEEGIDSRGEPMFSITEAGRDYLAELGYVFNEDADLVDAKDWLAQFDIVRPLPEVKD